MKFFLLTASFGLAAGVQFATAQTAVRPDQPTDVQLLQKQVLEMQAAMQQMQAQLATQQKIIDEFQKSIATAATPPLPTKGGEGGVPKSGETLFPTTDAAILATTPAPDGATGTTPAFPTTDASVVADQSSAATTTAPTATTSALSLTAPIPLLGGGKNYMNISLDGLFAGAISTERDFERLEPHGHDPVQRGFTIQNVELTMQGAVDPYFEAFATLVFQLDRNAETSVELEEAWMQTTSLPWGFQLKGGQFLSPFGRQNQTHPHAFDFVDAALANGRILGPDGMRGPGLQVAWLAPMPWFSEFTVAAQNGRGETGYLFRNRGEDGEFFSRTTIDRELRGPQDLLYIGRWANSFDLTPTQTLLLGVSAAVGPNDTGASARTQLYGADIFYKWKSPKSEGGFPFVKWQTEGMLARFEAREGADHAAPSETFMDLGAYSQVLWGFRKGWIAGLRGDYVNFDESGFTDDPTRQDRWRISANLTWFPTEFSKIRVQYNHDFFESNRFLSGQDADSVFLQFEFILGAHAAHKF